MHVVTKIWYTHLGYERTKLAVRDILNNLKGGLGDKKNVIKVHILLHWPRCYDDVKWMNCEDEEKNLPDRIKNAGPAPHLDPDNAFIESWNALEEFYTDEGILESIGVSNFDYEHFKALEGSRGFRVVPHIIQMNVIDVVLNQQVVAYAMERKIHIQAYNVILGIVRGYEPDGNEFARLDANQEVAQHIHAVGIDLFSRIDQSGKSEEQGMVPPVAVILKWLTQRNISVVPRTANLDRVKGNSGSTIASIPILNDREMHAMDMSVKTIVTGVDSSRDRPIVIFRNDLDGDKTLRIAFKNQDGTEVDVVKALEPGQQGETHTTTGHTFVVYATNPLDGREHGVEFEVKATEGQTEHFRIDNENDPLRPVAQFHNQLDADNGGDGIDVVIRIAFTDENGVSHDRGELKPGESFHTYTTTGHEFHAYAIRKDGTPDKDLLSKNFTVTATRGVIDEFTLDEL